MCKKTKGSRKEDESVSVGEKLREESAHGGKRSSKYTWLGCTRLQKGGTLKQANHSTNQGGVGGSRQDETSPFWDKKRRWALTRGKTVLSRAPEEERGPK